MSLFKILGLLLILLASTLLGLYKANQLLKRNQALTQICISLERLADLVKCGTGNLEKLLKLSFEEKIEKHNGGYILVNEGLLKEDKELFSKLLAEMGISHKDREEKTVLLYTSIFKKRQKDAEMKAKQLAKLYNSLGFLIGISICIFLI